MIRYIINEIPLTECDFIVFITWGSREIVPRIAAEEPNTSIFFNNQSEINTYLWFMFKMFLLITIAFNLWVNKKIIEKSG